MYVHIIINYKHNQAQLIITLHRFSKHRNIQSRICLKKEDDEKYCTWNEK